MRMLIGLGTGFLILLIALFFTKLFILYYGIAVGVALIATSIIYFQWVFPYCTCIVPPDRAWVLANKFITESSAYQASFSGYRQIRAQKELQAGFHWKFFWESPDKEVDMTRLIAIENDFDEVYTLKKKSLVIIRWRIFYGPLPGNIVNYIRTRPDITAMRIKDRAKKFIQGFAGDRDKLGFGKTQQDELRASFVKLYGGPDFIDDEERELGVWTGVPEIIDIDQPKSAQEITAILDAASTMVKESKGKMTYEDAKGIILASKSSGTNVNFLDIASNKGLKI